MKKFMIAVLVVLAFVAGRATAGIGDVKAARAAIAPVACRLTGGFDGEASKQAKPGRSMSGTLIEWRSGCEYRNQWYPGWNQSTLVDTVVAWIVRDSWCPNSDGSYSGSGKETPEWSALSCAW